MILDLWLIIFFGSYEEVKLNLVAKIPNDGWMEGQRKILKFLCLFGFVGERFAKTRPKPAYGRQGLDWIVGPGYSFVVFSTVGQSDHFS